MTDSVQMNIRTTDDARKYVNRRSDELGITNGEFIERLIWEDAHGRDADAIEQRIKNKKEQLRSAEEARDFEQTRIEELRREIESLKTEKEQITEETGEYSAEIAALGEYLQAGNRLFREHNKVETIADAFDKPVGEVHQDIREHYDDLPQSAFELAGVHEPTDWREATNQDGGDEW